MCCEMTNLKQSHPVDDTPDKPVIAHVLHQLSFAGAEVLAAGLSRSLGDRFRFVFLCLDRVGPLGEELTQEGFEVINLQRQPGIDWSVSRRLGQAVRDHHIALLHAHQYTPFFYAALSRRFSSTPPILFTEHGRHYPDFRRLKRVIANRFLLRRSDRVTAVGQFVKQMLVDHEGLAPGCIQVIHNGIEPQQFSIKPPDEQRARIRAELGLGDDQPVILQVARFHPVKDHACGVRAMAHVLGAVPKAQLILVGDGPERDAIETLANELGVSRSVRFLGVRTDIPDLMAAADVFMLSSLSEGISVTLLEAMAAARPIAATDVGGNGEVVLHDQTGLLSPRGDAEALARNLTTLLRDPDLRRRMGLAGRDRLLKQFTQQQMHDAFAGLYEEMTAHR